MNQNVMRLRRSTAIVKNTHKTLAILNHNYNFNILSHIPLGLCTKYVNSKCYDNRLRGEALIVRLTHRRNGERCSQSKDLASLGYHLPCTVCVHSLPYVTLPHTPVVDGYGKSKEIMASHIKTGNILIN